jgi:predicted ATPase
MAATATLKSLTLTAFRGSATTFRLDFEKNKKLTLIYGENGTGKTTICDAFEFLAKECVSSLENRGMGKGLEKFWPTAGKAASALAVDLETSAAKCSGRIVNKAASITPPDARPRIELLRQQQILQLIQAFRGNASPAWQVSGDGEAGRADGRAGKFGRPARVLRNCR